MIHCMGEEDKANDWNYHVSIIDTPITIETTPRKIGNIIANTAIGSAIGYGAWFGMRAGIVAAEHTGGTVFTWIPPLWRWDPTKTALIITGAVTGATYGLLAKAIGQSQGPQGPFVNINLGIQNKISTLSENLAIQTKDVTSVTNNNDIISSPLEHFNSFFESFHSLINPMSEIPLISFISISIIFIF
jgi:hypothetical protein